EIQIGYAEANAQASEPPPLPAAPSQPTTTAKHPKAPKNNGVPPVVSKPLNIKPQLGKGGYVFPVYGNSSYTDTYGALRSDVPGGWHHGDDICSAWATTAPSIRRHTWTLGDDFRTCASTRPPGGRRCRSRTRRRPARSCSRAPTSLRRAGSTRRRSSERSRRPRIREKAGCPAG